MGAAAEIAWASEPTNEVFRHFFDDAPVGLAQCDRQGMVTIVNPCLEEMLGSSVCTNVLLSDLIRAEDRSECDKLVLELKDAKRTSFHIDSRPACADGHSMQWIVWRVNGKNGADAQIFAVAQDFDNRPSAHRRLQVERLETMGRLAGGVVHDFNNLLTGVLLYCDLLLATLDASNRARKYAEEIRKAGLQATSLVRQLLALAKPARNEPRLLSFNEIAEGMRNLLVRLIGENIDLKFSLDSNLGLIKMDPTQAQQVLLNLVLNARDAMPSGGQITIKTANCNIQMLADSPGKSHASLPCAVFAVEDNGCGMDAHTRAHLFEPFFTTKAGKGTGLGLATVHDIVTRHGGLIHVDSQPGRGTRIGVLLPVAANPMEASSNANEFHPARSGKAFAFKEEEQQP